MNESKVTRVVLNLEFAGGWRLLTVADYSSWRGPVVMLFSDLFARCQRPLAVWRW